MTAFARIGKSYSMRVLWITAIVVVIDQITKTIVRTSMYLTQSIDLVGDWLKFTFTENPGMAFGIRFGPPGLITIFSIVATLLIVVYMFRVRGGYAPYRACLGLILGGAFGNIIDRVFYGKIYDYAGYFQGEVVDFIHFDLWKGYISEAIPLIGGSFIALFPIWNVADMAIVAGVVGILVFQNKFHRLLIEEHEKMNASATEAHAEASSTTSEQGDEPPSVDANAARASSNGQTEETESSMDRNEGPVGGSAEPASSEGDEKV